LKARNFALQTEEDGAGPSAELPVVESDVQADEGTVEDVPHAYEYADGNQYDPDEVFVLEDLEESPESEEDEVRMGAVRTEAEPVQVHALVSEPTCELEAAPHPQGEQLLAIRIGQHEVQVRANVSRPRVSSWDQPYRSHSSRDKGGERPIVPKEERQCLAAYISLNGMKAYALFDTGSTADLMSPDFARVAPITSFKLSELVPIQLGCVGSRSAIARGCRVAGELGGVLIEDLYFDIANIDRYDVILGTTFMYAQNIILDVRGRKITVGGVNGRTVKAITPEDEVALQAERLDRRPKPTARKAQTA
jgi:hypothetical protein